MTDVSFFLPNLGGGGAERVMLNLATGFANQGLTVDLILVKAEGEYLAQLPSEVQLVDLKVKRLLLGIPALIQYLKQKRPRVLISALEDTNIVAVVSKYLAGVQTQLVVTVHNHLSIEAQNSTQLKRKLVPHLLRWFYPFADAVVAVSQGVAEDLSQLSRLPLKNIQVIYNPIVTPTLLSKIHEAVEHPWLLPGQKSVILAVGRLNQQKDFSTLIRAFAQVRQHRDVRLIILGEGEDRPQLEALVHQLGLSKVVDMPGFLPNPYACMAHSALLVMSSAWEGFGNVLVEAMASGTPIVATNCESGPAEILSNGKYGRLVSVGDSRRLAEAIIETLDEERNSYVLQHRSRDFSLDKILAQYSHVAKLC
ncbi:MAG: glycosyltransferase [Drouetiella hepatica Uher 2000/2452]|jgi:glycosyltransferase involved in cell wall biosynthesis|uniref:Glycosyltransferase n=1 Tax=Drouetiella hepatica Uher 2000/2452 TaxID=904376 RepID=A0A951QBE7_9CYAN|nr:glycosyltransferase [Drouetiella hepatica Uher 2000/2452]